MDESAHAHETTKILPAKIVHVYVHSGPLLYCALCGVTKPMKVPLQAEAAVEEIRKFRDGHAKCALKGLDRKQ